MNKYCRQIILVVLALLPFAAVAGNSVSGLGSMRLVPTFHCCSVYATYSGDDNTNSVCAVRYRVSGQSAWHNALACWDDNANKQYKGSIVYLQPSTTYDVAIDLSDSDGVSGTTSITNTVTTWNETPQVGSDAGWNSNISSSQTISTGGSGVSGMRQYGPSGTSRISFSVSSSTSRCLVVNADNVLIQNIDFSGGQNNCIKVTGGYTNIWIRNCTFSNWGWPIQSTGDGTIPDQFDDAAITFGDGSANGSYRCVVESCTVNPPQGGANSWSNGGHPCGPHGIFFSLMRGECVCRYNRVYGSSGHYYNDGIGGYQNESVNGAASNDSDIYGNIVSEVWDDAIESDGGNRNVRIFGNTLTNVHTGISTAANNVGPSYVFRNFGANNNYAGVTWLKRGISSGGSNNGRQYVLFNTVESPNIWQNVIDNSGGGSVYEARCFNNLFHNVSGYSAIKDPTASWTSQYDYDMLYPGCGNGTLPSGSESHMLNGTPSYVNGYYLASSSTGYHAGKAIANIGDDASGNPISNPNVGAYDERFPALLLGPQPLANGTTSPPSPPGNLHVVSAGP